MSGDGAPGFALLDWAIIAGYLTLALGAGVLIARRGGGNMENFFLSGRRLPWWLAGTSMVATSFASDTPLVVSGWTRAGGVAGNWRWWAYVVSTVLVVVLFSRLWQRSRVLTDVEFMELRYSGRPARFLRGFKGVYQVVFLHCFVMGWVILGMTKVLVVLFDLGSEPVFTLAGFEATPAWLVMAGCAVVALLYSEIAGLWGVVITDFIQFTFALVGSIVLMVVVADAFGGLGALVDALRAAPVAAGKLDVLPGGEEAAGSGDMWRFVFFVGVLWFANKNADGSGVMVQRLLACRSEGHALGATLWYAVAHFALRPWPWIVVALASLLVLPPLVLESPMDGTVVSVAEEGVVLAGEAGPPITLELPDAGTPGWQAEPRVEPGDAVRAGQVLAATDDELAYPLMMRRYLPAGLLGLLVASFLAAFMSTIDTHVNLASSYLVNDTYRRFVRPDAEPGHYVRVARFTGPFVLVLALVFAAASDSVRGMFDVFTTLFSGVGVVYLLRWTWWRINAWSEISALTASGVATWALEAHGGALAAHLPAGLLEAGQPAFALKLLIVVAVSTAIVIPATLCTRPVDREHLQVFVDRVRPLGVWGPFRSPAAGRPGLRAVLAWVAGTAFVLACILLPGDLLLHDGQRAGLWIAVAATGLVGVFVLVRQPGRHAPGRP